ncbi:MAG: Asp-tRNA(Asn)/Glu-tRNA(Gln) amidotransferase subunit GatA [Lachnospiraceae bacterium]|nr:Asp-tRNA(Asn)/Glu-tRNA(Gln) amidotransferase subunit GatA [Lachnospiraceae bacterium]
MDILQYTAVELAECIRHRKIGTVEALEAVWQRIDAEEAKWNCYITVEREKALKRAATLQRRIEAGEQIGPFAGVPFAVKDNLCTKGIRTTCGSRMLEQFVPTYSAAAVERLEAAGAVIIGKTNMDEFAMGSTTETSYFGVTHNPCDPACVPGGSSGGSAAAVAAGECFAALGTDTGGSVRQPASHCGVVGLKPTYGTVSRYGLVSYASSMDQIGPLGRDVRDCAAILDVIAGRDDRDATSVDRGEQTGFKAALRQDVEGMRIGVPADYFTEGLQPGVRKAVQDAAEVFRANGAVVEYFDLGLTQYVVPAYYTIAAAEASSNLERFDGIKYGYRAQDIGTLHALYQKTRSEGFGAEVKRRILLGTFVLSTGYYDAYYLKAQRVRTRIRRAFDEAFANYDVLLGPVAPTTAPRLGESLSDPLQMYLQDIYTISANLTGMPAISVPCGTDEKGLPVGLQLMGDRLAEGTLLRAAYTYEQAVKTERERNVSDKERG